MKSVNVESSLAFWNNHSRRWGWRRKSSGEAVAMIQVKIPVAWITVVTWGWRKGESIT